MPLGFQYSVARIISFLLTFSHIFIKFSSLISQAVAYFFRRRITPADKTFEINPATLYLVSTPIGNLRDITLRALDTLRQVNLIAAEDTRKSRILLDHFEIKTPLKSYHDFNKERVTASFIKRLNKGDSIAVISDAGTPGISDPAFYLVRQAIAAEINIEAIPGATAFVPSLVISGLPTDRFAFEGFLPAKKGRKTRLQDLSHDSRTLIFYESPNRIKRTLGDLYEAFGERDVVVARELTKKFETILRGSLSDLNQQTEKMPLKGEFVIIVSGLTRRRKRLNNSQKIKKDKNETSPVT